jgi:hypothetical protein
VARERRPRTRLALGAVVIHTTTRACSGRDRVNRFGVQITSPARTIADVAEAGGEPGLVISAVARALATGLVSPAELTSAARSRSTRARELIARAVREAGGDSRGLRVARDARRSGAPAQAP